MARFISKPNPNVHPYSEVKMAKALRYLSDDWAVIHSVGWLGPRKNRVGDGEVDFVLFNSSVGLIVLEVKGGGIEIESGQWFSVDRRGERHSIKDPYVQAMESKVSLYKWLQDRHNLTVPTAHAVVFPDISQVPDLGAHAPTDITVTSKDMQTIAEKIGAIADKWKIRCNLSESETKNVINALAPTVSLRRTISDEAFDANQGLIELTLEQIRVFSGLRRNSRAVIFGGAGTGKTVLAVEKARQIRDAGETALLVCYNELLKTHLASDETLNGVVVSTFHSLCLSQMRKACLPIPDQLPSQWWEKEAPYCLFEALEITDDSFDAIIVDEGQDFSKSWIEVLEVAAKGGKQTPYYIFADENQNLWARDWEPQHDWTVYELTLNCRNTKEISKKIESLGGCRVSDKVVSGPTPKWSELRKNEKPENRTQKVVHMLLDKGFSPREIVVLCENFQVARHLKKMAVGELTFCEFGRKGIAVETISRFKGLESQAIVTVLNDYINAIPDRMAYVGFSRAKTYLHVIAPPGRKKSAKW